MEAEHNSVVAFPLLEYVRPREYEVAVERFSIPLGALTDTQIKALLGVMVRTTKLPIVGEWSEGAQFATLVDVLVDPDKMYDTTTNKRATSLIYLPNYPRKTSFTGQGSLTEFDCKFYGLLKDGSIIPIYLPVGEGLTLKLVFIRSDVLY